MNNLLLRLSGLNMQKVMGLGVILAGVYYFTLFDGGQSLDTQIANVESQTKEEQKKQVESEKALKEVEQIRAAVVALGDQYKTISEQIPTEIQPSEILKTIDQTAAAAGVSVRGKEPKPNVKKDIVEEMPIRVTAEGNFSELTFFLYNMMTTPRISRVLSFTISQAQRLGNERRKPTLTLEVLFANYRFIGDPKSDVPKDGEAK